MQCFVCLTTTPISWFSKKHGACVGWQRKEPHDLLKKKNKILKPWKPNDPYLSLFKVPRSLAFTVLLLLPSGRFFGGRSRNRTGWEGAGRFERASTSEGPSQRIGKLVTPRTRTRFGAFVCWYTQNTVFGFVCFGKNSKSCHLDLFSHGKITSHIFGSPVCWFGHSPVV